MVITKRCIELDVQTIWVRSPTPLKNPSPTGDGFLPVLDEYGLSCLPVYFEYQCLAIS